MLGLSEVIAKARETGEISDHSLRNAIPAATTRVRMARMIGWPALEASWRRDLEYLKTLEKSHGIVRKRHAADLGEGQPR